MRVEANVQIADVSGSGVETSSTSPAGAALLPDPTVQLEASGDIGAMLAAIVVRSGQSEKRIDNALRASEEAAQDRAEASQVQALHDQASATRFSAWTSGMATIGSSACSAGTVDPRLSKGVQAGAETSSKAVNGLGNAGAKLFDAEGDDKRADAADAEHAAGRAKRAADDAVGAAKDAQDLVNKALQFLKEYTETKNQALAAAVRRA